MAEDPRMKEYMNHIRSHPKFQPNGAVDEAGFYNQPNGSFFDPEGYYFNERGYDEVGGYYDENGQYCEEGMLGDDYGEHEDATLQELSDLVASQSLERAGPKTVFNARLRNLPFAAKKQDVEAELAKRGVTVLKSELQLGHGGKLSHADVAIQGKKSAKTLLEMKNQDFLGRQLWVELMLQEDANADVRLV